VLSSRESSRRYRTAISTDLPDGLPRILREADQRLTALRQAGHPNAGGLVIAADSSHARRIAKLLREATGRVPLVVLHTEAGAAAKLAAFTHSREPWIVAVNMVSEGVDIPRLRIGVYATAAKTPLVFRQIVGRFVRTLPGRPLEPSWLYVPADPVLRDHAASIEHELRIGRRDSNADDDGLSEEREPRRESERTDELAFVPLNADVAPQMTLFGPPAPAPEPAWPPAPAWPPVLPGAADATTLGPAAVTAANGGAPPPELHVPAFERRARLRDERHRLVSEVRRRDGSSHREVNAWLNRKLGIASVEQASLEDLERSVKLLVGRLSANR
jgi:superfamily II DNA or RNA helicase